MDIKVPFKACDMPTADNFTINIFATFAEREVGMIRERTKGALGVIKNNIQRDGFHLSKAGNKITSLGINEISDEHRLMGLKAIKEKKDNNANLKIAKAFAMLLKENGMNFVQITKMFNENGLRHRHVKTIFTHLQEGCLIAYICKKSSNIN